MILDTLDKAPDELLDYDVDFTRWLAEADTVASAVITITDSTMIVDHHDISVTKVKVWLSGGIDAESAHVSVLATTQQGRIKESCFRVRIREC